MTVTLVGPFGEAELDVDVWGGTCFERPVIDGDDFCYDVWKRTGPERYEYIGRERKGSWSEMCAEETRRTMDWIFRATTEDR